MTLADLRTRRNRRKGRPSVADKAVGRAAILAATIALLKTCPSAKMSLSQIARAAGVDPALIRYYFGDLTGLLRIVAQTLSERMLNSVDAALALSWPAPRDRFRGMIAAYYRHLAEHPYQQELFNELIGQRKDADAQAILGRNIQRVLVQIKDAVIAVDPAAATTARDLHFVAFAMFGMLRHFIASPAIAEKVSHGLSEGVPLDEAYVAFVSDLLLAQRGNPRRA